MSQPYAVYPTTALYIVVIGAAMLGIACTLIGVQLFGSHVHSEVDAVPQSDVLPDGTAYLCRYNRAADKFQCSLLNTAPQKGARA